MTCPQCAAENPPGASFCAFCGTRLPAPAESDSPPASTGSEDRPRPAGVLWPLSPGMVLAGRFEIVRRLGEGPWGVVWLARDRDLKDKEVALKVWRPELGPDDRARLIEAAVKNQSLSHPGLVKIFNLHRHDDLWWQTQAYVPGVSLDQILAERRQAGHTFSVAETARVVIGVLDVLQTAHETTPHLGLKPQNVMVIGQFPEVEIKLTDLAVSPARPDPAAIGDQIAPYLAPEQVSGTSLTGKDGPEEAVGPAADIYAAGVIMSEMLTGRRPSAVSPPTSAPALPPGIEAVLDRATDPDPAHRFTTAGGFRRALAQAALAVLEAEMTGRRPAEARPVREVPVEAPREVPEEPGVPPEQEPPPIRALLKPRRKRVLTRAGAALVLVVAVAAAVVGYVVWDNYRTERNIRQWTAQAAAAWKKHQWRRARHFYRQLAEARPEDRTIRRRIASAEAKIKDLSARAAPLIARANAARQQKRLNEARDLMQEALRIDPRHPKALKALAAIKADQTRIAGWLQAAEAAWRQKKYQTARGWYLKVAGLSGEHPVVSKRLATIAARQRHQAEEPARLKALARKALAAKDPAAAKAAYGRVLKLVPGNKTARQGLARIAALEKKITALLARADRLWRDRKFGPARRLYVQVLGIDSKQRLARTRAAAAGRHLAANSQRIKDLLARGAKALAAKDLAGAKAAYGQVLKLDSGNTAARQSLARIAALEKRIAARKRALNKKVAAALAAGRTALAKRKPAEAKGHFQRVLALAPKHPAATRALARVRKIETEVDRRLKQAAAALDQKDWGRADGWLKQVAALDADNKVAAGLRLRWRAAMALLSQALSAARRLASVGDLRAALKAYQQAAALAPHDRSVAAALSRLKKDIKAKRAKALARTARLIAAEKWAPAARAAEAALKLDPKSGQAYALRGTTNLEREKFRAALADYDRALKLGLPSGKRAGVHYERCFALFRLTRYRQAVRACSRAIKLAPRRAAYYRARAAIYRRLKKNRAAARDMARYNRLRRRR